MRLLSDIPLLSRHVSVRIGLVGGVGIGPIVPVGQEKEAIGQIGQIEGTSVNLNSVLDVFNSSHTD